MLWTGHPDCSRDRAYGVTGSQEGMRAWGKRGKAELLPAGIGSKERKGEREKEKVMRRDRNYFNHMCIQQNYS